LSSELDRKIVVKIDEDLFNSITEAIKGKGFSSVDDFVNYALRIAIGKKGEALNQQDTEAITARLKALGYI